MHRDHFAPHNSRKFEGYYARTQLSDGSTLAIIFCWVRHPKTRGNYVLVSYTPLATSDPPETAGFKHEFFPERIDVSPSCDTAPRDPHASFTIAAPGVGSMTVTPTTTVYEISVPAAQHLRVHLTLDAHTPWAPAEPLAGPMGAVLHISRVLPLNWHVRSTRSRASYVIEHSGMRVAGAGGFAHLEKNWGGSFPSGWIWAQAFSVDGTRSLCLAGGCVFPGVQAYLVGYRSPEHSWTFGAPLAMGLGRLSPCLRVRRDPEEGEVEILVETWTRRMCIKAKADLGSFLSMSAPMRSGMEPKVAHESFRTKLSVGLFVRGCLLGGWEVVEETTVGETVDGLGCGVLEFGGSYWDST